MNGMNFKPFISKLLDSLSDEQINKFNKLIDSHENTFTNRSLINAANLLTTADKNKDVGLFTIQLDQNTIRSGYLIYNDTYCVLLAYVSNSERISEYKIDMSTMTYVMVKEYLTTDYLRHEVAIRNNIADDVEAITVSNIKALTNEQIEGLKCGDVVLKKDSTGSHSYKVTFKSATGICLTYQDASVIETQSYDKVGNNWVYNSEDKSPISPDGILESLEDKDLVVKTLKQTQANWSLPFDEIELQNVETGITYTPMYARFEQIGNLLFIVWTYKLTNTTENNISMGNPYFQIELPESVADKIYDFDGYKVSEAHSAPISADIAFRGDNTYPTALNRSTGNYLISNVNTKNKMRIDVFGWSSINAGVTQYASFRTFLTLL